MESIATVATRQRRANISALNYVDVRLVEWGKWARAQSDYLGYPRLSLIYKVLRRRAKRLGCLARPLEMRLKGLTARGSETRSLRPKTVGEVDPQIAEVDRVVAVLELINQEIIRIEYLMREESVETKATLANMYPSQYRAALKRAKLAVVARIYTA